MEEASMTRALTGCIIVCLLTVGGLVAQQRRQQDIDLQAAIRTETVDGDLQAAIKRYNEIVSKYGKTDRAVAAQALVHVAECYQKLGSAQAQTVYAQIVRDYADQTEAVAAVRARTAATAAGGDGASITERVAMATTGAGLVLYTVTADGRFAAGSDESNGDLIIRDMTSGQVTHLMKGTLDPRTGRGGAYADFAALSRDQHQVAFTRYGEPGNPDQGFLWVMRNQPGGTPRLVKKSPEFRAVQPLAWFPDGRSVFAWIRKGQPLQLEMVRISVADGSLSTIKLVPPDTNAAISLPRLSPDGRFITYSRSTRANQASDQAVFILDADGSGREVAVTQTAGVNSWPVWTPDGRHLVFLSNRTGNFDLWATPVRDGRAYGSPVILRRNIGSIMPIGMTQAGSYYYKTQPSRLDSITVARASGNSWIVDNTLDITGVAPSWSPDGKAMAFNRAKLGGPLGQFNVMIKRMDTGEERVVAQDQYYGGPAPTWLSNDKLLVNVNSGSQAVTGVDTSMKSLAVLDVTGQSPPQSLFTFDLTVLGLNSNALARDGKGLYFIGRTPKDGKFIEQTPYCVLKLDLATQRVDEIAPLPKDSVALGGATRVSLSPDGRFLAFKTHDKARAHVMTVNVDGGVPREAYSDLSSAIAGLVWAPDGRGVLIARQTDANRWEIVRVAVEGGSVQATTLVSDSQPGHISVSADGSRLAFVKRASVTETKVLDNVMSALK
jgi:Tol biopolymer transport system component